MLYPINKTIVDGVGEVGDGVKKELKWAFAPMVEIPEEERENFPNEQGGFYDKKIDTDNAVIYNLFLEGMNKISQLLKENNLNGK